MQRISGIAGILVLWEIGARLAGNPMFPPLTTVLPAWAGLIASGAIWPHMITSIINILAGFSLAAMVGFSVAVAVVVWPAADRALMPVVDMMRPIAALTLFPLIILILGLGISSKIFIIFWTAWPAVVLNSVQGIRSVDREVIEAALLDGAWRSVLLRSIEIPLAAPTIVTGLRIGLSGGWISLVSAEMLGSQKGLGYSILAYSQTFRFPEMYSIVLTIALLGLGMNLLMAEAQKLISLEVNNGQSNFLRFHDRAISFGIDAFRLRNKSANGAG